MWPSNDDTFSPAVALFKTESKVRTRPHLQAPKTAKIAGKTKAVHLFGLPPSGGGEEVTRNLDSYNFITQNGLQTQAGVKKFLAPQRKGRSPDRRDRDQGVLGAGRHRGCLSVYGHDWYLQSPGPPYHGQGPTGASGPIFV